LSKIRRTASKKFCIAKKSPFYRAFTPYLSHIPATFCTGNMPWPGEWKYSFGRPVRGFGDEQGIIASLEIEKTSLGSKRIDELTFGALANTLAHDG
jgi:hypothetical protein